MRINTSSLHMFSPSQCFRIPNYCVLTIIMSFLKSVETRWNVFYDKWSHKPNTYSKSRTFISCHKHRCRFSAPFHCDVITTYYVLSYWSFGIFLDELSDNSWFVNTAWDVQWHKIKLHLLWITIQRICNENKNLECFCRR